MPDQVATVVANKSLPGGHFLLDLLAPRQAPLTRPGQFAMLRVPGEVLLRRPMSIYDVKPSGTANGTAHPRPPAVIQLLYKVVGSGTRLMAELKAGDEVSLLAPLGHGFFEEDYLEQARKVDEVLHVAGGIGIAALLMPAKSLGRHGIRQRLFFGGRTQWDLQGLADFEPFTGAPILATEDGSRGSRGYVTFALRDYLDCHREKRFLLLACGPWAMLHATVELARAHGHAALVSMENRMGCGLGVCLGCCIRVGGEGHGSYERVCTEGPVFWATRVIWEKENIPKT